MKPNRQAETSGRKPTTGTFLIGTEDYEGRIASVAAALGEKNEPMQKRAEELRRAADLLAQVSAERLRFRFLSETSALLSASLDYETTLTSLSRILVPTISDGCGIFLARGSSIRCVATSHADAAKEPIMLALASGFCRDADDPGNLVAMVMRERRPIVVSGEAIERGAEECLEDPNALVLFSRLEMRWVMAFPFLSRDRVLGAILLYGTTSGRDTGEVDVTLVQEIASRAAIAVDNAMLYQEARRAIEARDNLMAIVSHDLRNSLSLAMMSAAVLDGAALHDERRERAKERVASLRKGLGQMRRLIEDLLDFASLEAGQLSLICVEHDAAALVNESLEAFQESAEQKGIKLEGRVPSAPSRLVCDGDRIRQVISNLLGNALKFTPQGGSVVLSAADAGDAVEFTVSDTGCGIPPDELPRVFEAYGRAARSRHGGRGLGLFISRGVVESHGGAMWVESTDSLGTTFRFRIPKVARVEGELGAGSTRTNLVA
jgi:signal transduction histidine kinase